MRRKITNSFWLKWLSWIIEYFLIFLASQLLSPGHSHTSSSSKKSRLRSHQFDWEIVNVNELIELCMKLIKQFRKKNKIGKAINSTRHWTTRTNQKPNERNVLVAENKNRSKYNNNDTLVHCMWKWCALSAGGGGAGAGYQPCARVPETKILDFHFVILAKRDTYMIRCLTMCTMWLLLLFLFFNVSLFFFSIFVSPFRFIFLCIFFSISKMLVPLCDRVSRSYVTVWIHTPSKRFCFPILFYTLLKWWSSHCYTKYNLSCHFRFYLAYARNLSSNAKRC